MGNSNAHTDRMSSSRGTSCPYCQRRFETQDELTLHIVTRHTQLGIKRGPAQAGGSK